MHLDLSIVEKNWNTDDVSGGSKRPLSVQLDLRALSPGPYAMSIFTYLRGFEVETAVLLSKTQGSALVVCSEGHFTIGI